MTITPEMRALIVEFCTDLARHCEHVLSKDGGPETALTNVDQLVAMFTGAADIELQTAFKAQARIKGLWNTIYADAKEKMLAPELYARSEDGLRKLEHVATQSAEFMEYLVNIVVSISKFPNPEVRNKLRAAVAMSRKA